MIVRFTSLIPIVIVFRISYATIISVPGDYPTIQAAVDASTHGDEVILTDGVYSGEGNYNIDLLGKAITVRSESGNPENCIIDVRGQHDGIAQRGFYLTNYEGSQTIIRDIIIMNSVADAP